MQSWRRKDWRWTMSILCVCGCRVNAEGKSIFFSSLAVLMGTGFRNNFTDFFTEYYSSRLKTYLRGNHTKASLTRPFAQTSRGERSPCFNNSTSKLGVPAPPLRGTASYCSKWQRYTPTDAPNQGLVLFCRKDRASQVEFPVVFSNQSDVHSASTLSCIQELSHEELS